MPSDVRMMSDEGLFDGVFQYLSVHESVTRPYIEKLTEAKRRLKIMRELCKAAMELGSCVRLAGGIPQHVEDEFNFAVSVFNQMEQNVRDLETMPLRKLVDLALASDRMTAGRYLHEIKRRLPMLEAAVASVNTDLFMEDSGLLPKTSDYRDAYRAAREATRETDK